MSVINRDKESKLSYDRLILALTYSPASGYFYWNESRVGVRQGKRAGSVKADGSRKIRLDGLEYLEHRLAWFYYYKEWPIGILDHIDQDKTNNKIANLRESNTRLNSFNRPDNSEYGPNIYKIHKNFCVQLQLNNKIYRYAPFSLERAKSVRSWLYEYLDIFNKLPEDTKELQKLLEIFGCE